MRDTSNYEASEPSVVIDQMSPDSTHNYIESPSSSAQTNSLGEWELLPYPNDNRTDIYIIKSEGL